MWEMNAGVHLEITFGILPRAIVKDARQREGGIWVIFRGAATVQMG